MAEKIQVAATTGQGPGRIPFTKDANGKLVMASPGSPVPHTAPESPASIPEAPAAPAVETTPPATPFNRLYPGVDPAKVEFFLEENTNRFKLREIEREIPAQVPDENSTEVTGVETPATEAGPDNSEIAGLRSQVEQQNQLMQAMLMAQAQGKPLAEYLGLQPAQATEPSYEGLDLYDPGQLAGFIKQQVTGAIQGAMAPHQQTIQGARQQQEYNQVFLKHGKEPDFPQKAALTSQLLQGNPNVSFEGTYNLISTIQGALAPPTKAVAPLNGAAKNAGQTITLTPEQAAEKAAQAARLPGNSGVRSTGAPTPPEAIRKDFKKLATWVAHQQALGNL